RRSLVMLLVTALGELWPGTSVSMRYAVPDGGYYCTLLNRASLSADELEQLDAHMREIVAADDPLTKKMMPLDEALALFKSRGEDAKIRLMEQRKRQELAMYTLRGRADYYYGYKLPSTGYLQYFRLIELNGGFILQYPRKENPTLLRDIEPSNQLTKVFNQADDWLDRMKVEDIGRLNRIVRENRVGELILVAEALHELQIARMASDIYERHHSQGTRLVLIAGPSSSGKTTFAKRLAIQLLAHGLRPFTLELDNYFVDRDLTPKDENGLFDFEALQAIHLPLFNNHLLELMGGKLVRMPRFDFVLGKSVEGRLAQLTENQIIIIEGIHGLNPALVPDIPPESIYRVYVSALTQLNIDSHNRVPTTDVGLLRRLVRDATHRGHNAAATIDRWPSVRRGEKLNIFPYQENADAMFNSALVYELAALRPVAEPLLQQVEPGTLAHIEANRLLSFIRWVVPFTAEQETKIPDTSLLREFIGGSILTDYHPVDLSVGDEVPPES
ncbi:MAG: nucleoside kinase, partial [Burkholderiales bacterium]|nr:nucleoside kinase [Anaerolineae bacterium]